MAKNRKQQAAIAISMKSAGKKPKVKMQPGGKVPTTPAEKKFAALAPPKNKITFADKIAGAKKKAKKGLTIKKKDCGC